MCLIFFSNKKLSTCRPIWPNEESGKIYYICIALIFYVIPLFVILVLYIDIAKHLSINSKLTRDAGVDSALCNERAMHTRRAIIKMAAIVVAFLVCVFPRHAVHIFFEFVSTGHIGDHVYRTYVMYQYLAYLPYRLHVAINPIIYSVVDPSWRKEAHQVICHLFSRWSVCRKPEITRKRSTGYGNSDLSSKNNNGAFSFTNDGFV